MAIIKCQNCGETVSDKATACPHCGSELHNRIQKTYSKIGFVIAGITVAFIILITVILVIISSFGKAADDQIEISVLDSITPELQIASNKYDYLGEFIDGVSLVRKNHKYGYIDINGKEVIKCDYSCAWDFSGGRGVVAKKGYSDINYYLVDKFANEYFLFKYNYKADDGFLDHSGRNIQKTDRDDGEYPFTFYPIRNGIMMVHTEENPGCCSPYLSYYCYDINGNVLFTKFQDGQMYEFSDDLTLSLSEGYINRSGKVAIKFDSRWETMSSFKSGVARVSKGNKYGFISKTGNLAIAFIYDDAKHFSDSLCSVKKGEQWGVINRNGDLKVPFKYDDIEPYENGFAMVKKDGKYGYIDSNGSETTPCLFYDADNFSADSLACVMIKGKYGYINTKKRLVIPAIYEEGKKFSMGLAVVKNKGKYGVINTSGKIVHNCVYEQITNFSESGFAVAIKNGKYGYIDKYGKSTFR